MQDEGLLRSPTWLRNWPHDARWKHAKVPKLFAGHHDDSLHRDVEPWAEAYERGQLLLLRSRNTARAASVAAALLAHLSNEYGESIRWVTAEGYIEMYKEEWDDDSEGERWRELKYITRGFDVLAIDGLGEEPNTAFERKILASLIRTRFERGLTTIITTPLSTVDIGQYGGRVGQYVTLGTSIAV